MSQSDEDDDENPFYRIARNGDRIINSHHQHSGGEWDGCIQEMIPEMKEDDCDV